MALKKETSFLKEPLGEEITGEYWIIVSYFGLKEMNKTTLMLSLYKDKDSRDENIFNKLCNINLEFEGLDFSRSDLYEKIKELPKFSGAKDC